jgi:eukaryotic-like serine/threonine-protein kinase
MNPLDTSKSTPSRIAIALSSEGSESEGARGMLQERISLWALWVFVLSSGFYLVNVAAWPLTKMHETLTEMLLDPSALLHLAASLLFGAVWVLTRRVTLSHRTLRVIDVSALIGGCTVYAVMGYAFSQMQEAFGGNALDGLFAGLLATFSVMTSRAIIVPSTSTRTLWTSAIAALPIIVTVWARTGGPSGLINFATWSAVVIAISSVGSHVIYGLRVEADRVRRLGQYTLEEKIGAGGMGVVYRARHAMLRRPTAIKLLPPDRAGEANLVRFEREVQLTAELSHPNTIAIYDYGRTPDGIFYYAMEYLEGINLEQLVNREGPVPPGRVISILRQVCGALGEAHSRGLLHRDIKPANIILTERGGEPDVAKVVDFGLVKPILADGPNITVSESIVLAGTPLYMAPEALTLPGLGDARSDLYALAAVGYFLLTGKPVFEAATMAEAFGHHLHTQPVRPSERLGKPLPSDLEALILRCLSKNVDDRPAAARAMERELKKCAVASPWTPEQAAEWWRAFRASGEPLPVAAEALTASQALTVSIDLSERTRTSTETQR